MALQTCQFRFNAKRSNIKSYGDTSAALGKDLSQMIEAVADAATGEFERLKSLASKPKTMAILSRLRLKALPKP